MRLLWEEGYLFMCQSAKELFELVIPAFISLLSEVLTLLQSIGHREWLEQAVCWARLWKWRPTSKVCLFLCRGRQHWLMELGKLGTNAVSKIRVSRNARNHNTTYTCWLTVQYKRQQDNVVVERSFGMTLEDRGTNAMSAAERFETCWLQMWIFWRLLLLMSVHLDVGIFLNSKLHWHCYISNIFIINRLNVVNLKYENNN